jgi:Protein of unknown function (DUF3435)
MLIVWAFRCKAFKDYATPDELFNSTESVIELNQAMLDQPVFLNNRKTPLTTDSVNFFLSRISAITGIIGDNTTYTFRRSAANKIFDTLGGEHARKLLHHTPNSNMLIKHYINRDTPINTVGIMLGTHTRENATILSTPLSYIANPITSNPGRRKWIQENDAQIIEWKRELLELKKLLNVDKKRGWRQKVGLYT